MARKPPSRRKSIRRAVDRFNQESDLTTIIQHEEFSRRRHSKRQRRQRIDTDRRLALYRRLYIPTLGCLLLGTVFSVGGTVRGLSEKTFMWKYRQVFCVVGPVFLILGVVLLLASIALITRRRREVGKLVALRRSLRTLSRPSSFVSLPPSIDSSDKMCHSLEDLDELEQSLTSFLTVSGRFPEHRLSLSNSQVSFSEHVRVHEIKDRDVERDSLISCQDYERSLAATGLPYRPESVSFRLLEGVLRAQKSTRDGNRTIAKYRDQLHIKPTEFSNEDFVLHFCHRNQINLSARTSKAIQNARSKLRVLRALQSGTQQTTSAMTEEHIPLQSHKVCSLELEEPNIPEESTTGFGSYGNFQTASSNPQHLQQNPHNYPSHETEASRGAGNTGHSRLYFSAETPLKDPPQQDSNHVPRFTEIQVVVHPPEN